MMRCDVEGVGGFFEDLPVLAFVLAGVVSVAGTASWVSEQISDADGYSVLEVNASLLVDAVVSELTGSGPVPSTDSVRGANLTAPVGRLADGIAAVVSVWCVHPVLEPLVVVVAIDGDPSVVCSHRALVNAVTDGGVIGIVEVRALVWEA